MQRRGDGARAAREPALDGLRGVAVALVLLFHGGASWMSGGYLGVSLFFTLSGFLITRLLLDEIETTGSVRLGVFYARRARRLLPASLLCLAAVIVAGRAGAFDGFDHLRRDLLGALFQIYNWVQLGAGGSYRDLISSDAGIRSPLDHYWSLAIEEQFYWLWPLCLAGVVRVAAWRRHPADRQRRTLVRFVVGAALVTSCAAPLIARVWGPDAAYWSTPARAAEILLGGAAAALFATGHLQRVPTWLAPVGLGAIVALAVVLPADGGFAYHGGLVVVGVASALVLLALRRPSHTRTALSWRPLVAIGAVSYGLYLFHWPVFVVLDEARTGLDGVGLFGLRLAVTAAITILSYRLVEQPVRRATWRPARTLAAAAAATAVALAAISAAPAAAGEYWAPDEAVAEAVAIQPADSLAPLVPELTVGDGVPSPGADADPPGPASPGAVPPAAAPSRAVRILVVGDSTALAAASGLTSWASEHPRLAQVSSVTSARCGFLRDGAIPNDGDPALQQRCDRMLDEQLLPRVERLQPDVVALLVSSRDGIPRQWDSAEGVIGPDDARFVARLDDDYRRVTAMIAEAAPSAVVAWVRPPIINPWWEDTTGGFADPVGHGAVDGVAAAIAGDEAGRVAVVDLRGWMEGNDYATRQDLRPDGIHFTPDAAAQIAAEWLGPELLAIALG